MEPCNITRTKLIVEHCVSVRLQVNDLATLKCQQPQK